jgi:hypothetical protein
MLKRWGRRLGGWALVATVLALVWQPALLAFPYQARFGDTLVRSERPIAPAMGAVLGRAEALARTSPLYRAPPRTIYLTDGGWRWTLLAAGAWNAFALRRPFTRGFVVNSSDIAADRVENGRSIAGRRTLSGVIAHETMHIAIANELGELRAAMLPAWKAEGYADHVARESSLTDAEAARLQAAGEDHPALAYHRGRRRVAEALARNGGDVRALLRD